MSEVFIPSKEALVEDSRLILGDPLDFSRFGSGVTLRAYQKEVALAVVDSVLQRRGLALAVMFPRQSGKNELQAQLEAYLLCLFSGSDAEIVKVSPTWKPQSQNAMRRLERTLQRNPLTRTLWQKEAGYIYRVGSARIYFLSAAPESNIVGATASTNATRIFWGTAWTGQTLLGRELRAARRAEKRDGIRRVFRLSGEDVAKEVPEYGKFVAEQVSRLRRSHPMVCTQYFSEEITAESGMFPGWRVALMKNGSATPPPAPLPGRIYAFLLDVAGQDEGAVGDSLPLAHELENPRRDATALTIVEVDLSTLAADLCHPPHPGGAGWRRGGQHSKRARRGDCAGGGGLRRAAAHPPPGRQHRRPAGRAGAPARAGGEIPGALQPEELQPLQGFPGGFNLDEWD